MKDIRHVLCPSEIRVNSANNNNDTIQAWQKNAAVQACFGSICFACGSVSMSTRICHQPRHILPVQRVISPCCESVYSLVRPLLGYIAAPLRHAWRTLCLPHEQTICLASLGF